MNVRKAVITAAGRRQRGIPLQRIIDRDGVEKSVLRALLDEVLTGPIEELGLVVAPHDEATYLELAGEHRGRVRILVQPEPRGYGHAIACAQAFTAGEPFFHCVSDHLFVSSLPPGGLTKQMIDLAESEGCSVSAVQATPERMLTDFWRRRRSTPAWARWPLPGPSGTRKAYAHRSRAALSGARSARRTLPLFLRHARPHAAGDGMAGRRRVH